MNTSEEAKQRAKNYMKLKGALETKEEILKAAEQNYRKKTERIPYPTSYWIESKDLQIQCFVEGATHQAEKMYSEEEVKSFLDRYRSQFGMDRNVNIQQGDFIQWFNKWKK
jgi:hypothetical protein